MSPTVATKSDKQQEAILQQYHLCLAVAEHQILGGQQFLIFGTRNKKNSVVEKGTISPEKVPLPMDIPAWKTPNVDFSQSWQSVTTVRINPSLAWASGSYRVASSDNTWRLYIQGKGNHSSSTSVIGNMR